MNLKKIFVVLNGFVHDFASGIWLAAVAAIGMLHGAHLREPTLTAVINPLERHFFWWSVAAMLVILATGAGRTFTYVDNWYGADAERVRRRMLIIKHVLLLAVFALGYWYVVARVFH
ncbi:MAG: hypothetical protein JJE30_05140 [Desulfuromonadales bacterium]|nr:hypothetical protein [Desulfuromonadales bacterium]